MIFSQCLKRDKHKLLKSLSGTICCPKTPRCHAQNSYCPGRTGTYGNPRIYYYIFNEKSTYKINTPNCVLTTR